MKTLRFWPFLFMVVALFVSPIVLHAEPATTDADNDGITDVDETTIYRTDPFNFDSDHDGFSDGEEVSNDYDPTQGSGVKFKKRIQITLKTQQLSYFIGPKQLGTFTVSTGAPGRRTPTGTFFINNKTPRAWSRSALLWMPWWMSFIGSQYGIHELPEWPGGKKEGANHLGTPVSHGCVRLGIGPAKTLYDWAEVGTQVDIIP